MKHSILNNMGLKLLALLLAIVTWAYIVLELQKSSVEEREIIQSILPYRMISKKVPIELDLIGEPRDGYKVAYNEVVITPSEFVIVGPKAILNDISSIETQPIDITGLTKTLRKDVSIIPPARGVIKEKFITVTVPIHKEKE